MSEAKPGVFLESLSSADRKGVPVSRALFAYFPDALALVARHSARSNEKHNPGQPIHWSRDKSTDHEDCVARHSLAIAIDPNSLDDGQPHMICRAWRALAALQVWAEAQHGEVVADDGWVKWEGGGDGPSIPRDTPVTVRLRGGGGWDKPAPVKSWSWFHSGGGSDIVAYKVAT